MIPKMILSLLIGLYAHTTFAATINDLSWMSGEWKGTYNGLPMQAFYSDTSGGVILGQTKIANGAKAEFFEFEAIHEEAGTMILQPMPFATQGVSFNLKDIGPSRVVFENPQHDFPQRIIYELKASGQLWARIEGVQNGQPASDDCVFSKVEGK